MRFILSLFFFVLFCCLSPVYPHAILQQPTARTGQAVGIGRKIPQPEGPSALQLEGCGPPQDGITGADPGPGAIVATYTAGQSLTVKWKVTIDHTSDPGVRVAIKYNNNDKFGNNIVANGVSVQSNLDGNMIASTTVTLPAGKTGTNAVLQWIWYSIDDGGYYIACSDIRVNAATGGGATTAAPGAGTTSTRLTTKIPISSTTTVSADGGDGGNNGGGGEEEITTTTKKPLTTTKKAATTTKKATTRKPGGLASQSANGAMHQYNTMGAFMIASIMAVVLRLFY